MAGRPTYDELEQRVRELEAAQYKHQKMRDPVIENIYRALFENMLHEVHFWELIRDESGEIKTWKLVDANPAALKSWNRSLPEVVGKTTDEIFPESNPTEMFLPIVNKIFSNVRRTHGNRISQPLTNIFIWLVFRLANTSLLLDSTSQG